MAGLLPAANRSLSLVGLYPVILFIAAFGGVGWQLKISKDWLFTTMILIAGFAFVYVAPILVEFKKLVRLAVPLGS